EQEAAGQRSRFFTTYRGLQRWHARLPRGVVETRTLTGRIRRNVEPFTWKANSPVQGSGADGLKLALGRLWQYRQEAPTARLVTVVHDEVVVECPAEDAAAVADWLTRHMVGGMEDIVHGAVPIAVEASIARDWAGTPLEQP
ncbi:MAG TPA: DNA polymerase, partial [Chloroflexota bacterium]|nr:DNA polymerase [Chloroflexota bacterium]